MDTKSWSIAASWCSTARGSGIWHSGSGPAVDSDGFIYVVTGNDDFDGVTDFGESIVKLKYTAPGRGGALTVVDWWTLWTDDGTSDAPRQSPGAATHTRCAGLSPVECRAH